MLEVVVYQCSAWPCWTSLGSEPKYTQCYIRHLIAMVLIRSDTPTSLPSCLMNTVFF